MPLTKFSAKFEIDPENAYYLPHSVKGTLGQMQRILIVGQSGSGKSMLASMLSAGLQLPWRTGDQILRAPDHSLRSEPDVREQIDQTIKQPLWVIDGNTIAKDAAALERADTLIWLNYSAPLTAFRFMSRSLARLKDGETMLGEPRSPHDSFKTIAKDVYWAARASMRQRESLETIYGPMFESPEQAPHLQKIRLTNPAETSAFLKKLGITNGPTAEQKHAARHTMPLR